LLRRIPNAPRETMRTLEALSRFEETPGQLVIELTEDHGYIVLDTTAQEISGARKAEEREGLVLAVLPATSDAALHPDTVIDKLHSSKGVKIGRTAIDATLEALRSRRLVDRLGEGLRGNALLYYR